jgi:hypothetical protein
VCPLPITHRETKEAQKKEKRRKERRQYWRTEEGIIALKLSRSRKRIQGKGTTRKRKWKTRRATNGGSLEVVIAR